MDMRGCTNTNHERFCRENEKSLYKHYTYLPAPFEYAIYIFFRTRFYVFIILSILYIIITAIISFRSPNVYNILLCVVCTNAIITSYNLTYRISNLVLVCNIYRITDK